VHPTPEDWFVPSAHRARRPKRPGRPLLGLALVSLVPLFAAAAPGGDVSTATRRIAAVATAVVSAVAIAVVPTGSVATGTAGYVDTDPVPCAFWYAIGTDPTPAQIDAAASRDRVIVLNAWETDALARIKQRDPSVTVLVYKDLSSTRDYEDQSTAKTRGLSPAGVTYRTAQQNQDWFATDRDGRRIEWNGYDGHWQMAVWDESYRQAWVRSVTSEVVAAGWDGVLADNDLASLSSYSSAVLAGTSNRTETDELLRDSLDTFVTEAGESLQAAGKLLVPNLSDARLYPGRWEDHSRFGGAMEENFVYFAYNDEYVGDWADSGWQAQTDVLGSADRISLAMTRTDEGDERAQRYGFASAAVRGHGTTCWSTSTTEDYSSRDVTPEQQLGLGAPTGPGVRQPNGVWTRAFERGWVAVNPTGDGAEADVPQGLRSDAGTSGQVRVPATDAVVLRG
jgi:hypothetical protein